MKHRPIELSPEASAFLAEAAAARTAMEQAARATALAADELRRHAKFSRPGQPPVHIVQLRQKQASARVNAAKAKQAFLQAAKGFLHASGSTLPPGKSLESFMLDQIQGQEATPGG